MKQISVLIIYRNFGHKHPASHVGLGINGLHTARVLRREGIPADLVGVWTVADVRAALQRYPDATHAIIEAPWIPTAEMQRFLVDFPAKIFVLRCHSQMGFLQVEAGAITLMREAAVLEAGSLNFHLSANSTRFCDFFRRSYHHHCHLLPNLYDLSRADRYYRRYLNNGRAKICSFGALRLLKNHSTAAAAALLIGRRRRVDVEFHVSVNREEHGKGVLTALRNMFSGLNWARLVDWASWPEFRNLIGTMDLAIQASHTETFNIVTADAAAELVPSVVSDAIEWAPACWRACPDDAEEISRVGNNLLNDPDAGQLGHDALGDYVTNGIVRWKRFLQQSARDAAMSHLTAE